MENMRGKQAAQVMKTAIGMRATVHLYCDVSTLASNGGANYNIPHSKSAKLIYNIVNEMRNRQHHESHLFHLFGVACIVVAIAGDSDCCTFESQNDNKLICTNFGSAVPSFYRDFG